MSHPTGAPETGSTTTGVPATGAPILSSTVGMPAPGAPDASRRRLVLDAAGIAVAVAAFAVVYGLAARQAGFSLAEATAMSVFVFAGASQFAAVGLITQGLPWVAIVGFTALLNARHILYSAALAPWVRSRPAAERAVAAHLLTDESFALSLSHFGRVGRADMAGYWLAAAFTFVPWQLATLAGYLGGQVIPDPRRLGLDVVFPAAFAGLGIGLVTGRREIVAAVAGGAVAVVVGLAAGTSSGVVAGGLAGPLLGMLVPGQRPRPLAHGDGDRVVESSPDQLATPGSPPRMQAPGRLRGLRSLWRIAVGREEPHR